MLSGGSQTAGSSASYCSSDYYCAAELLSHLLWYLPPASPEASSGSSRLRDELLSAACPYMLFLPLEVAEEVFK